MCPSTGVHYLAQLSSPVKKKYSTLIVWLHVQFTGEYEMNKQTHQGMI